MESKTGLRDALIEVMEMMNDENKDRLSEQTKLDMCMYILNKPGTEPEADLTIAHQIYENVLRTILSCYMEEVWENMIDDLIEYSKAEMKRNLLKEKRE